jgi:hypothetical protein
MSRRSVPGFSTGLEFQLVLEPRTRSLKEETGRGVSVVGEEISSAFKDMEDEDDLR